MMLMIQPNILFMVGVVETEAPFAAGLLLSLRYSFFVKGDQTNFKIGAEGVEACELYPDVKYTNVEEYLDQYV